MKSKQLIAYERGKLYVSLTSPAQMTKEREEKLISLTNELMVFGYTLLPEVLLYLSEEDMENVHKEVLPQIASQFIPVGTMWKPLYPGFPQQVIEKSEMELWEEQHELYDTLDYDAFLAKNPWYNEEDKKEVEKNSKHNLLSAANRVLGAMKEKDILDVFKSILASGNSLHETTREELDWLLSEYPDYQLPDKIPFKETMCIVMSRRKDYEASDINDILRYGIYQMGGNPELVHVPKKVKRVSWEKKPSMNNTEWRALKASRPMRVDILGKIENILGKKKFDLCMVDAKRFYGHWLMLSERLHPGEYENRFPQTAKFFRTLKSNRLNKKYKTWNSVVQDKYNSGEDILDIAKFISLRPGEFVRRFDSLLRRSMTSGRESDVMDIFLETSGMSNKTLLELRNYYEKRASRCPRLISVKGSSTMHSLEPLEPLPIGIVDTVREFIERKILLNIKDSVKEQDLKDKVVYIDPMINRIPVPSKMRDAVYVVPPCTRYDIPADKKYIRLFVHWIQEDGKIEDLDLHGYLYQDEHNVRNVGWNTGLKSGQSTIHSGDVLNRPGDCTEFIDIDIDKAIEEGWNYVVMDVYNYKGRGFNTLPCWLGFTTLNKWEGRENKEWNPSGTDISNRVEIKDSKIAAWIFDLNKRQAICLGVSLSGIPINTGNQNSALVQFFAQEPKFTSYDVLCQYYKSRGATIIDDLAVEHDEEVKQSDIILTTLRFLKYLDKTTKKRKRKTYNSSSFFFYISLFLTSSIYD